MIIHPWTTLNPHACFFRQQFYSADPDGAAKAFVRFAEANGTALRVAAVSEIGNNACTYLGGDAVSEALDTGADVVVTGRVADAALFLGPLLHEFKWKSTKDSHAIAQGLVAGHLLECGTQVSGGFFWHPSHTFDYPVDPQLPIAEISHDGRVLLGSIASTPNSAKVDTLSSRCISQQLLYEIHDPSHYITPDMTIDLTQVTLQSLAHSRVYEIRNARSVEVPSTLLRLHPHAAGLRAWGEISYTGRAALARAKVAYKLICHWLGPERASRTFPSYVGALPQTDPMGDADIRLHVAALYSSTEDAAALCQEVEALYTNGPAGGGGVRTGIEQEFALHKELVARDQVKYRITVHDTKPSLRESHGKGHIDYSQYQDPIELMPSWGDLPIDDDQASVRESSFIPRPPRGEEISLYRVCHARAGDKGDRSNICAIPYHASDIDSLASVITPRWVSEAFRGFISASQPHVQVYRCPGINAINIVIDDALDGGVCLSRRIDRHGKTLSDVFLSQKIVLPKD
eukprot:TRINITY_DN7710_c0_g2_i7.p1 TRINITY_DN7710_c0_g2~~TRINITY_DN7710_c0_g2_i7.p1  ORF type:complete len:516 (-),score=87.57 TRINITY_DN7710_c0_g2_i7:160-1707(-)